MAIESVRVEETVDFRKSSRGWSVSIPNALLVALVTAVSTGLVTRCNADAPRGAAEEVRRELGEIKATQRQILDKLSEVERDAKNRDAIQDASIAVLRNR